MCAQGGQQQDSHELLGKLIEGLLAEEVRAAKALQQAVSPGFTNFYNRRPLMPQHQSNERPV